MESSLPARRPWLSPRARRTALVAHIVVSVGWIGLEVALLTLGVTGVATGDPQTLRAAYVAAGVLGAAFIIPTAAAAVATGLVLGWGTKWGVLRHWWVIAKLVITIALLAGGTVVVNRRIQEAADEATTRSLPALASDGVGDVAYPIIGATAVGTLLLIVATVLSVVKPWGRRDR